MAALITVERARQRIIESLPVLPHETVGLNEACGRVLARDLVARRTQPPVAVSAMDGYAVRAEDVARVPVTLRQIGEAPAGRAFEGRIGAGETVRIFTGAPLPDGADCIVIQENTSAEGARVTIHEPAAAGRHVRAAGIDFTEGETGLMAGRRLRPADIAFAAAMDLAWIEVVRKPRIAVLSTGDELVRPGEPIGPSQIVNAVSPGLVALIRDAGGEAIDLGIARDDAASLRTLAAGAKGADMLVTIGGASVGDHDLVQSVLGEVGLEIGFWRIAMRPGRPLMFGRMGAAAMMGLPGNPVSAMVCAIVFLRPAIAQLGGLAHDAALFSETTARLGRDLPANDERQDYLRARLDWDGPGPPVATPFVLQDSSVISGLARANCLVIRPPGAPPAKEGDDVPILLF